MVSIHVNDLSLLKIEKWQRFLTLHPHNTIFQSYDMYQFYQKVQNFEPFLFYAEDEKEACVGVLLAVKIKEGKGLKGYFSSRVVVYGGPLIIESQDNTGVLNELLKSLIFILKNKSIFIQFRNFFPWDKEQKKIFKKYNFHFKERLNIIIPTVNKEQVWSGISSSRRRQINKGIRSNVSIDIPKNEEEVKAFYFLLKDLYKNKVKKPLPDWSFFKTFYQFTLKKRLGVILLVKKNSKIIGGIVSPVTEGKCIYEWYIVGLDKQYKYDYPSVMATWSSINFALNNNISSFDFMGLGVPSKEYGVREFKLKFGGTIVNYGRFGRRNQKVVYKIAELGYNTLRLLKRIC